MDVEADTMKVALTTSSYSPSQDADDFFDDVTNEVSSSGYTAGGYSLTGSDQTYTSGTNVWAWDAGDPSWTGVTFAARYAVYYDSSPGSDATRPLVSYLNFGADQSISGANFSITHDAGGIVKVTLS